MRTRSGIAALIALGVFICVVAATPAGTAVGASGAPIPQGTQTDAAYAGSGTTAGVTNVFATTQKTSCYTPEVPFFTNLGPALGYSGMSACNGRSTTGEDLGPYPTQSGSNPGNPASTPMLVKDHSESDIRVDPTNPQHIIGTSKWFVSSEGYNHQLGFYESFNGGRTWSVQGHIPGWEGWTDSTDPVGAFDTYGNFWFFDLAYQFFYNKDGSHNFSLGRSQEPNPAQPAEIVGVSVRPHGAKKATDWISTVNGKPDIVADYDNGKGNEPDKQWLTVDTTGGRFTNRIYLMWVNFHTLTPVPYVAYADARADGTHTPWSTPKKLPQPPSTPQGATYVLPHVAPDGAVYSTVTNFDPSHQFGSPVTTYIVKSADGGTTWSILPGKVTIPSAPPLQFANTTFRDGITDTFGVGNHVSAQGRYPLYIAYEDYRAGWTNVLLTASYDDGTTWTSPIQVNDDGAPVDEFQPNLSVAPNGTVSVAFYDRRLACPTVASKEGAAAGIALDPGASGASNYCVNSSVQFYDASLRPLGHNIRLTQHAWDPQLNAPHPGSPGGSETFIGDYFGNDAGDPGTDWFTFVSTYDDGSNPSNRQQQVVAIAPTP
ncbi:MAG: hypothetical protein ACJ77N_15305 [Chloroflexota bacterium]